MRTEQGFTLVETLVAILLLSILIMMVTAPITGLFGMTRDSTRRLSATGQAQQALEYIKSEWEDVAKYNATCVLDTLNVATLGAVTVEALNYNGVSTGNVAFRNSCASATSNSEAPIKRVTIVSTVQTTSAQLTIDLARPQ